MLFNNKLFNSIACLLSFINLQLVIPGRTWILLYLGRTVYKRLWVCLALYIYMKILEMDSMVDKEIENVTFQVNSMLYPPCCVKMEQHGISTNMHDLFVTNILIGETKLPQKIFVMFVRHNACSGDLRRDPFNYQHFGIA